MHQIKSFTWHACIWSTIFVDAALVHGMHLGICGVMFVRWHRWTGKSIEHCTYASSFMLDCPPAWIFPIEVVTSPILVWLLSSRLLMAVDATYFDA